MIGDKYNDADFTRDLADIERLKTIIRNLREYIFNRERRLEPNPVDHDFEKRKQLMTKNATNRRIWDEKTEKLINGEV